MTSARKIITRIRTEGYPFVVAVILLATGVSLLLVASLSVPLFQTSWIFRLTADVDGVVRFVDFGIWGYCLNSAEGGNNRSTITGGPRCTQRMLGWIVGSDVVEFLQTSQDVQTAPTATETSMLMIYPTSTVLLFAIFVFSLAVYIAERATARATMESIQHPRHLRMLFSLGLLTTLTTSFVLLVHLELVSSVKKVAGTQLSNGNPTLHVEWGNTTWLCVSALICLCGNILIIRSIQNAKWSRESQIPQLQSPTIPSVEKPSINVAETHVIVPIGLG